MTTVRLLSMMTGRDFAKSAIPKIKPGLVVFDRSIIRKNWKKINGPPLMRAGLLVRRIARGSIRRAPMKTKKGKPTKPSAPGRPPKSKSPGAPMKLIFAVPQKLGTSVVVGIVGFGGKNPVPGLHEHGGSALRMIFEEGKTTGGGRDKQSGRFLKKKKRGRKRVRRMVRYPERPVMTPALVAGRSKMPQLWKGSLR